MAPPLAAPGGWTGRMIRVNLIHNLAAIRRSRGLTQQQLAARAFGRGSGHTQIARMEAGAESRPTIVAEVAEAVGVAPGDLLYQEPGDFKRQWCRREE